MRTLILDFITLRCWSGRVFSYGWIISE